MLLHPRYSQRRPGGRLPPPPRCRRLDRWPRNRRPGAQAKHNQQLPEASLRRELGEIILVALARHPLFFSAALPLKYLPRASTATAAAAPTASMSMAR